MKFVERLKKNKFWSSVASISTGRIVAQAINLISIPFISRIYSKTAYGDFGIVTSSAIIIMGFIGLGLGSAIMAANTQEESEKVLRSCFLLQLLLSTALCLVIMIISPSYKLFITGLPYLTSVLVMYLYLNLSIHASLMSVYINRLGADKVLLINPLLGAMCTLLITLPLGLIGWGSVGLYAANIISLFLTNLHMLHYHNPYKERFHFLDIMYIFRKYKRFVIYQYPSNLMGTFSMQLPMQVIARFYGSLALGDYAMTNRVFGIPSSVIAGPIQTIYFRTASERTRSGESIVDLTYSLVTKIMLIAAVPLIIGVAFSEEIFSFVLGAQWKSAGTIASVMAFPFLFNFCNNCVTYCRVVIGKQKVNLIVTFVQIIFTVGSLLIGVYGFGSLAATIICFSIVETLYSIFNLYVNFYCLKQKTKKFLLFTFVYLLSTLAVIFLLIMFKRR